MLSSELSVIMDGFECRSIEDMYMSLASFWAENERPGLTLPGPMNKIMNGFP